MITLQNFLSPDPAICTEHELYFHTTGETGFSQRDGTLWIGHGGTVRWDTYFNLFNLGKWHQACRLDGLFAEFHGEGRVEIRLVQAIPGQSWEILSCEIVTLEDGSPYVADLSHYAERTTQGLIFAEIRALDRDGATLTGGRFATADSAAPALLPRLAVSITTFKREKQVRQTVTRLDAFLQDFDYGDQVHVQVVDNGQSAEIAASKRITPIANPNYGGAGGFARGLLEAEKADCSHCLFMDDDASFHMENIARAYVFLMLAHDPKAALAGAMITNTHKWALWENGAWFDGSCHPLYCGTDLRAPDAVFAMEFDSTGKPRPTTYGGWWFFAFTIAEVKHHPFPFFVRGDDISFSLMNDFRIYTLNGVVSFQDDFAEKESAQTLYLDLRNHLIHHLVSDDLARSPLGTAKVALRFIMRSLVKFHYETARAQLLAWQDVMKGPHFFDENIDMAARRATIKEMMKTEIWQEIDPQALPERRRLTRRSRRCRERLGYLTLNGHLMPFSEKRWDRIVLDIADRGIVFPALGASQITYLNTNRDKGYTVRQSKREFFTICREMYRTLRQFLKEHEQIKAAYRRGYQEITTRDYWEKRLG
ncbi:glycosyltransferase family 2 protein [Pseudodonghicola xiamenensis]|uniref:Glycosyl transferase n=1 Tax=Pseudodonghicola xiamenensis TaxID=337702 RepID=A0A8J3MEM7_9RHOB|nr:glycosyltransferase [Pseudodonghicola xiamenensis]GHG97900.1 glycosyl transferase [Pseudodonghicola xiamenensis]